MSDTAGASSRCRPQFSLATLLLSVVTVAVCCAWWQDHTSGQRKLDRAAEAARFGKLKLYEQLRDPETIGMAVTQFPEIRKFADKTFDEGTMPELWKQTAESRAGKSCVGYYFQFGESENAPITAWAQDGATGFYVLTINERIVLLDVEQLLW